MKSLFVFLILAAASLLMPDTQAAKLQAGPATLQNISFHEQTPTKPHERIAPVLVEGMSLEEARKNAQKEVIKLGGDALVNVEFGSTQRKGSLELDPQTQMTTSATYTKYFVRGWAARWVVVSEASE